MYANALRTSIATLSISYEANKEKTKNIEMHGRLGLGIKIVEIVMARLARILCPLSETPLPLKPHRINDCGGQLVGATDQ